jgi:hypothetical protein
MIAYNGGSISNVIKNINKTEMFVTDTVERATRYANAQATGVVNADMNQDIAEGAIVLFVECEPRWFNRSEDHTSLDVCEAWIKEYRIVKATIKFHANPRTLYGRRPNYMNAEQVVSMLRERDIEVEVRS